MYTSPKIISRVLIPILAIFLLLVLAGCGAGPSPGSQPSSGTAPVIPVPKPQPQVEPQLSSYTIADSTGDWGYPSPYAHYSRGPGYIRMHFIFETLVWKNATSFIPQLAREWEYNADDNSYTFKLQQNVKWHDGADFTADDVVFTFNYAKEHPYQWVDNSIVKSVAAVDRYTVKLYLSKPYAPFLNDVAGVQPILPQHIWQNVTEPEKFLAPEAAIGTGPYTLGDYSKEHGTYLFKANDGYYLGKPAVREIKFVKIAEEMNPAALKAGTVDSASVQPEVVSDIKKAGFTVITDNPSWNGKLTINHKKEPLSSVEFRQALAYAIDRQALAQIVFRGNAIAGSPGMVPPTSVWYNPETPQFNYDLEKAKQLIEGLGYQLNGAHFVKDGKSLKLSLITAADYKDVGQFVTQQLEKVGIEIDFQTLEGKTVDSKVGAWDFDLSIYGHGGLFEPSFLPKSILSEGFNSARYHADAELTQLLQDQLTEMDTPKRKDMVFQIQKLYAEDMPALSLYYPISYWAHDGRLPLYYTMDGIATGIPIPLNRMSFVK
jgi:peptide/nickel transport system substrate-binding protein